MSLWTSSVLSLLLLQAVHVQAQQLNDDGKPAETEAVAAPAPEPPRPVVFVRKDWNLTQAYFDVFKILSNQNTCSSFYGGPRSATTVFNGFVTRVKSEPLARDVSFQMTGSTLVIHDPKTGATYRVFDRVMVNTNGSFYQRRSDPMRNFPSDVGEFSAGSRPARALILLHELGHLMEGEDGEWLIPDDGHNGPQSKANTLRVQEACRKQLQALQ